MPEPDSQLPISEQIANVAKVFQQQRTGHLPKAVSVVISGNTLVITLHGALSPAEQAMAATADGAAQVQEFHRQLFLDASGSLRRDIKRITGMEVREASAELEPSSGTLVQVFNSGTMVQVFELSGKVPTQGFDGELNA